MVFPDQTHYLFLTQMLEQNNYRKCHRNMGYHLYDLNNVSQVKHLLTDIPLISTSICKMYLLHELI